MAVSLTAPASSWWTAGARFAASTLTAKTPSCATCCTMCDNWSRNAHDDDHDAHPAHHQRSAERHLRRAPGLGLYADPPPADRRAPPRDDHGLHHFLPLSGLLLRLSPASRIGPFPKNRSDSHDLFFHPGYSHGVGRDRSGAGNHHASPRLGWGSEEHTSEL